MKDALLAKLGKAKDILVAALKTAFGLKFLLRPFIALGKATVAKLRELL